MTSQSKRQPRLGRDLPDSGFKRHDHLNCASRVAVRRQTSNLTLCRPLRTPSPTGLRKADGALQAHAVIVGLALVLSACAVDQKTGAQSFAGVKISDDPCANTATTVGVVVGAVAGGVIGNQVGKRAAGVAGALVGAAIGGMIGRDIDRRRCELFKIARKHNLELSVAEFTVPEGTLPIPGSIGSSESVPGPVPAASSPWGSRSAASGLTVAVRDTGRQFEPGADQLTPQARAYFTEIAEQYSYLKQAQRLNSNSTKDERDAVELLRSKRILLVGHTDDTGSSRANADLSERRAMAVAKIFRDQGIPDSLLFYQGAGETLPIGDNHTDNGRAQNRRVEIVDVTDDATLYRYLALRTQRVEFYRAAPSESTVVAAQAPVGQGAEAANRAPTVTNRVPTPTPQRPPGTAPRPDTGPARPSAAAASQVASRSPGIPAPRVAGPSANAAVAFDFGGSPASVHTAAADFGREIGSKATSSLIATAYATGGPVVPTCSTDRPRVSNGVKSLRDQKSISGTEYMPGLYNTSWMDTVNGNLVGLANVAVLRDGGAPANRPNLYVYKNYKTGGSAKPDYAAQPDVNAYRGDKAILYRVFVDGPIRCMDVVFPYDNSGEARNSNLFYDKQDNLYVANFKPKVAR